MGNTDRRAAGMAAMLLSSVLFSVMALLIRLAQDVNPFLTSFVRFAVGACVVGTMALAGKAELRFVDRSSLLLRGIFGGTAVFLYFLSINKIGIARGSAISNLFPVFATLGSALFLGEKVRPSTWAFLAAALCGVALLNGAKTLFAWELWTLLALGGAVLSGLAIVMVRKATRTDGSHSIFMSQSLIGFWMVIVPAFANPAPLTPGTAFLLLGIGIFASGAQLLMTWSYKHLDVAAGSLLSMATPLLNVGLGVLIFRESLGLKGIMGMALILVSCACMAWSNGSRKSAESPAPIP
jgi:drug/metabolite transporter (DMT)-like permease